MPANRKDRRLTGSFKPSQAAPALVYSKPPPGELNAEQKDLLKLRPKRLTQAEKLEYRRCVVEAPWLQAGDRELLLLWIQARTRYQVASKAFDRLLRDPEFSVPGSVVAKAAIPLGRLAHREAAAMINLAHRLGFSPAGRLALGVDTRKPPEATAEDPWVALRLVPGGLSGTRGG
jgi:hypothetical protein